MSAENKGINWREAIDIPEKVGLAAGGVLLALSAVYPPFLGIASELIVGSATSLGVSNAAIPRKNRYQ